MKSFKTTCLFILTLILSFSVTAQKLTTDQASAKKVVVDFFKWYRNNSEKINSFKLYKGKKTKDNPPYVIDWKEVEKYFDYIRKNVPSLGETFIENERKNFKNIQVEFTKYPEDDLPHGFDFDRFTNGQESPEFMIDDLLGKNYKIEVELKSNTGKVMFVTYVTGENNKKEKQVSVVEVAKEKGKWKMAKNIEFLDL